MTEIAVSLGLDGRNPEVTAQVETLMQSQPLLPDSRRSLEGQRPDR